MSASQRPVTAALIEKGRVSAADVIELRRSVFPQGLASDADADALIGIERGVPSKDPAWGPYFTTALGDYFVNRLVPPGEIDEAKADWLVARIAFDDRVETGTELALLMRSLEAAKAYPKRLIALALKQVRMAVLIGEGAAAEGRVHWSRTVDAGDMAWLGRIVGVAGARPLDRVEADLLFDMHDAATNEANDPQWSAEFTRLIASHLAGRPMMSSRASLDGAAIAAADVEWLVSRARRDGRVSEAERALLAFAKAEIPDLDSSARKVLAFAA